MNKIIMILATAGIAAVVGGSALAHDNNRHGNDRNSRDRGMTERELVQEVVRDFRALDRNNDNRIGPKEIQNRHFDNRSNRHGSQWNRGRGNDNLITPAFFHRFNKNRNRFLTLEEARMGARYLFRQADRNRNGYLNDRELENAPWYNTRNDNRRDGRDRDRNDHGHRH